MYSSLVLKIFVIFFYKRHINIYSIKYVLWNVNPLLGIEMLNELPWRRTLDKHSSYCLVRSRERVYRAVA
jgi:hypothetical protein